MISSENDPFWNRQVVAWFVRMEHMALFFFLPILIKKHEMVCVNSLEVSQVLSMY